MSLFPRPLVPEISVCSPPKSCPVRKQVIKTSTKRASSEKCLAQREKDGKPQFGMACKPPSSLAKSGLGGDIATLRSQLNKQQTEISEMKRMIENLVAVVGPAKVADCYEKNGTPLSTPQELDVKFIDFGCQVESACPHCGRRCQLNGKLSSSDRTIAEEEPKRENDSSVHLSSVGVQKAAQEKPPSSFCVVSQTEKQFVNEMIKAARKWLQTDDNLDDIDETPSKDCDPAIKATDKATNANGAYSQVNAGRSSRNGPSEFAPSADNGGLSMEINALAMRYLNQNGDEPPEVHRRRGVHFESPNYMLTRRQQVVTEEVSMAGLGGPPEVSLSSREYLERHGVIGPSGRPQHRVQEPRFAYDEDTPNWYPSSRPQRRPQYYPDKFDQYDNACYRRYRNC
ncbi:hypothetical protein TTRE_0000454001 [Trichuris trichiura]|uniref:Uncharacterized protein n=1 Tax=Trichuris trichiura TaxID=36087 RepID=A0A077ZCD7_TRITR|nr:hypothetical protein TTRE_0000454001 [Trichuris trichiura]